MWHGSRSCRHSGRHMFPRKPHDKQPQECGTVPPRRRLLRRRKTLRHGTGGGDVLFKAPQNANNTGFTKHTTRGAVNTGRRDDFGEAQTWQHTKEGVAPSMSHSRRGLMIASPPPLRRRGREKILRALTIAQYRCTCALHCTCRGNVPLHVQANRSTQGVAAMSG